MIDGQLAAPKMKNRVIIVHRIYPWEESNLDELEELCCTAGYEVVYRLLQRRYPHPEYNIGPSKLEELKEKVKRLGVSKVIFENELKPVQEYNLAKALSVEVMTRTRVILEIFSMHASNLEAKLQIKLAELKYELPRAREKVKLAKRGEQPGFHGLGSYEADVYYEEISRRINSLSSKLERIKKRKLLVSRERKKHGYPVISLAGYTNAGKSTLFNKITSESVDVSPKMFTTLSTTSRMTRIDGKPVYVSDTVGFIRNVPTLLISAFMSTLSEIAEADLILLLLDASEPIETIKEKLSASLQTLHEVGVTSTPIIVVLNKIDLLDGHVEELLRALNIGYPSVGISALTGQNLDKLEALISRYLRGFVSFEARLSYGESSKRLINEIYTRGRVINISFCDGYVKVCAEAPAVLAEKVKQITDGDAFRIIDAR